MFPIEIILIDTTRIEASNKSIETLYDIRTEDNLTSSSKKKDKKDINNRIRDIEINVYLKVISNVLSASTFWTFITIGKSRKDTKTVPGIINMYSDKNKKAPIIVGLNEKILNLKLAIKVEMKNRIKTKISLITII